MPLRHHHRVVWLLAAVAGLTCTFPTDKSDEVKVVIQAPTFVVIRGERLPLVARAFRVTGGDTVDVKNVTFRWTSDNVNRATVEHDSGGYAHVTGVNSGTVDITARAVAFEQADIGSFQVRVSNPLEVDSVRPSLVRFGDTVTVYGVGVDSIFLASLDNATLFDYPIPGLVATRTRDSLGFSTAVFWVPPPARTSPLSFIGPGVFGTADDTTRVLPRDALEMPNDAQPRPINLDGPPLFPSFPTLSFFKFYNPALAFEIPKRDEIGVEWYRFTQTNPRDLTLILTSPDARGTFSTFLTDSLSFTGADSTSPQVSDFTVGPSSWTLGPRSHFCRGIQWEPPELQPESTIVALRGMPPGTLHALSLYAQPGRYGLAVIAGYVTSDAAVFVDDHEEDDFCDAADARGPVPIPYRDTLTIDNPHDIDWIRFRNPAFQSVRIRTRALVSVTSDSTDIDLFLLDANSLTDEGRSGLSNSDENIQVLGLPAGDYYLVALDYIGAPARYWVCIEFNYNGCATPPPPPPGPPHAAPVVRAPKRAVPVRAPLLRPSRSR